MRKSKNTTVLFIRETNQKLKKYIKEKLDDISCLNLIFPESTDEDSLLEYSPEADIMVGWRPTEKLLNSAEKLDLFINPGAGVQHLLPLFRKINQTRRITLINNHGNAYFTAQHGVALLLALTNKIIPHHIWMTQGKWRLGDSDAASIPLRYRTVGLLGYGSVNKKVYQFLAGFNVKFAALRNNWSKQKEPLPTAIQKYEFPELDNFLKTIDTLIIAVPLTDKTNGLISLREMRLLGEHGLLINLSRGQVVDQQALFTALNEKIITAAGIDVWYNYHPDENEEGKKYPYDYPFHELDNIILSPHRAASPFSDLERWDDVIENIKRYANGKNNFMNVVDLENGY